MWIGRKDRPSVRHGEAEGSGAIKAFLKSATREHRYWKWEKIRLEKMQEQHLSGFS